MRQASSAKLFTRMTLLALILAACQPPPSKKNSDAPTAKISTVSEKVANCEKQIRAQMEAHTLQLTSVNEFKSEIESFNKLTNNKKQTGGFSAVQSGSIFTQIGSTFEMNDDKTQSSYSYFLSLADQQENPKSLLLNLYFATANGTESVGLEQDIMVDETCQVKPTSTARVKISKLDSGKYEYKKLTIYSDGGKQPEEAEFSIPENGILDDVSVNLDYDDAELAKHLYGYWPKVGVAQLKKTPLADSEGKEFGLTLKFKNTQLEIVSQDKVIKSSKKSVDKDQKITLKTSGKIKSWIVPLDIWRTLELGTSEDVNRSMQLQFSKTYLDTNDSLLLLTAQKPSYDHFGGYWNLTEDHSVKTEDGITSFLLQENSTATFLAKAVDADLLSNDTIQTDLPQIQKIAGIIAKQTTVRSEQIQKILDYLSQNYEYDTEMAKNNVVRPLSTEEALTRKKGVCQHYSVLFTTLARALKIPTRIVSGYSLSGATPISHAWVETEIKEGTWRVIEPQDKKTLQKMQTRFYFPITRSTHLESKNGDWNAAEYNIERTLKAVQ